MRRMTSEPVPVGARDYGGQLGPHPGLALNHGEVLSEGGAVFGMTYQEHEGHRFVTLWPTRADLTTYHVIGFNDMHSENPEDLERAIGRMVLKILDRTYPTKEGHFHD